MAITNWFSTLFKSDHRAEGRRTSPRWKQYITIDDNKRKDVSFSIEIKDFKKFPDAIEIKNIFPESEIKTDFKTSLLIKKDVVGALIEIPKLRQLGFLIDEKPSLVEITSSDSQFPSTSVPQIDELFQAVIDIHTNKDRKADTYPVTLNVPSGTLPLEHTSEGAKDRVQIICDVKKEIIGISIKISNQKLDLEKAKSFVNLFKSKGSSDQESVSGIFLNPANFGYQFIYPNYLRNIKNKYDSYVSQAIGDRSKVIDKPLKTLNSTISRYETNMEYLNNSDTLVEELNIKREADKRFLVWVFALLILSSVDGILNKLMFDKTIKLENWMINVLTLGFGGVIVLMGEFLARICRDYKDLYSPKSLIIILPLMGLLVGGFYIRYSYEVKDNQPKKSEHRQLNSNSQTQNNKIEEPSIHFFSNEIMLPLFFTCYTVSIFICTLFFGFWHKHGNISLFLNKSKTKYYEEKIRNLYESIKNYINHIDNTVTNPLIQTAQREMDEFKTGFEEGMPSLNEKEAPLFMFYLNWLSKETENIKVETGSQINSDQYHGHKNNLLALMRQFLRVKNKNVAFKFGFDDGVNDFTNDKNKIVGHPLFHREDHSIEIKSSVEEMDEFYRAYENGHILGKQYLVQSKQVV